MIPSESSQPAPIISVSFLGKGFDSLSGLIKIMLQMGQQRELSSRYTN
jgi:hypothetical protein